MMNRPGQTIWQMRGWRNLPGTIVALAICVIAPLAMAGHPAQKNFESPQAGVDALVEAVKSDDQKMLQAILGPHGRTLVNSGDDVADVQRREDFVREYNEASKIVLDGETRATLMIGYDEWPLPIPLVKHGERWHFDTVQGEKEILARRVGANELAAIQVCLAIVDAENDYSEQVRSGDGVSRYAARFLSTPGKQDGLYWETQGGGPESPLGPLLAAAASEGYTKSEIRPLAPYHGYYYKILTSQGANASGGAYDYLVKGRMIGGFAVLAYPARYGASGVMSFMVNHEGVVYEKNLGRNTAEAAAKLKRFDPDESWKKQQALASRD